MKSYLLLGIGGLALLFAAQSPLATSAPADGYNPTSSAPAAPRAQVYSYSITERTVAFHAHDLGILGYDSFRRVPAEKDYTRVTSLPAYKAPQLVARRTLPRFSEYRSKGSDEPNQG